ncbi:unnamed protein product [Arabidopsis thaliana]|uniref:Uncharacterized protein n=1 Tax=Arabidopsis thaliana TaxID=3702 RepID=A0A654EST7_ARATH|nr:unnamed protein product [Arabidopsis thaliana]
MSLIHDSVVIEDKVYVVDSWNKSFFYSPKQCKWGRGNHDSKPKNKRDWCMIDNLLYSCGQGGSSQVQVLLVGRWQECAKTLKIYFPVPN